MSMVSVESIIAKLKIFNPTSTFHDCIDFIREHYPNMRYVSYGLYVLCINVNPTMSNENIECADKNHAMFSAMCGIVVGIVSVTEPTKIFTSIGPYTVNKPILSPTYTFDIFDAVARCHHSSDNNLFTRLNMTIDVPIYSTDGEKQYVFKYIDGTPNISK